MLAMLEEGLLDEKLELETPELGRSKPETSEFEASKFVVLSDVGNKELLLRN